VQTPERAGRPAPAGKEPRTATSRRRAEPAGSSPAAMPGGLAADDKSTPRVAALDPAPAPPGEPSKAAPIVSATDGSQAVPPKTAGGSDSGTGAAKTAGEKSQAATASVAPPIIGPPVRLQAHLDHPRLAYRVGEWVALRFMASRPVHLRVYRVDPAGRVTRVYSTYGRDSAGSPARTFSTMVKAGEPKPGPEGMIAIGSTRPLTQDELLACLRSYMGEAGAGGPAPSDPPADALKAVIAAVTSAPDAPEAAAAPLDRSGWSIAVGQFTSAARKVSDDRNPPASEGQPAGVGPTVPTATRRRSL
jgi:hypothetical protein